ncbi:MAG: HAMP domain-containing histidine kinase [Eubacterium sp.]|nr:HAMP domain-containing histidine kinase [Eubacterium sp.]
MKKASIKTKITIWVSVLTIIIAVFSSCAVIFISNSVIQSATKRNLINAVENNINEISICKSKKDLKLDDKFDISIRYKNSYIEIDDGFIKETDGITVSLYDSDSVLYGESLVDTDEFSLAEKGIREVEGENGKYYIYDKKIMGENAENLWIRGTASKALVLKQTISIVDEAVFIIPILVIIAISGAFLLAKRALEPIDEISLAAGEIRRGKDLSKRISIKRQEKEVLRLSNSFNEMLERLEVAFNKEEQFTRDVSHELRTPLSVILSECELMLEDDATEEEYKEALSLIKAKGEKMNLMINSLLEYSRLEAGSEKAKFSKTDFSKTAKAVCEEMKKDRIKGITLEYDIENNIYINANQSLIIQLITNLISNAYKYGKENGHIYVSLKENEENAVLIVKDDGIGISEKDINNIFDTFFRADSSRYQEGFGLGLSFVKKIADLHRGTITVNSAEGEGSEFIYSQKIFDF